MQELRDPAERALLGRRRLVPREPAKLGDVVGRRRLARDDARLPHEVEHARGLGAFAVRVDERTEERSRLDLDARLLVELATQGVERVLSLVDEASEHVPEACVRIVGAASEEHAARIVEDERRDGRRRVRVVDEPARRAFDLALVVLHSGPAARAPAPAGQEQPRGYRTRVSPQHVPASVTELARVGLFGALPGETLGNLADRMRREDVAAGTVLVREGDPGDRFYVLLTGIAASPSKRWESGASCAPGSTSGRSR